MCVDVTVRIAPGVEKLVGAERLSRETGLHVVKHSGVLYFNLVHGGCGCTLMAGSPNPAAAMLELDTGVPARLETALRILGEESRRFVFATRWDGEDSTGSQRIPLRDLLKIVRENQIEAGKEYVVGTPA